MAEQGKITGLAHIGIKVRDMDASLKFYTETLGFQLTHKQQNGATILAFLNIGVAGGTRMAVYDMQKGELLFCVFSSDGENPPLTYGIPYERDGETVYLAPVKTDRDLLVCVDRNAEDFYSFRLKK